MRTGRAVRAWAWVGMAAALVSGPGRAADGPPPAAPPVQAPAGQAGRLAAHDLVAYAEFDGLDAHARAWEATAARAILEGTSAGAMLDEVAKQLLARLLKLAGGPERVDAAEVVAAAHHLARQGFAVAAYRAGAKPPGLVAVLPGFGAGEARHRFDRLVGPDAVAPAAPTRGRALVRPGGGPVAWWAEGPDLFLAMGDAPPPAEAGKEAPPAPVEALVAATLDAIEGKAAAAATHPGWLAARAEGTDLPGFEPDGLFFAEAAAFAADVAGKAILPGPFPGLDLPTGKYIHDDVKRIDADLDRMQAEIRALDVDTPKVEPPQPIRPAGPPPALPPAPEAPRPIRPPGPEPKLLEPTPPPILPAAPPGDAARRQAEEARELGIDAVRRVVGRWGFDGRALVTDVRVEVPAPRHGMLALLDQPSFRKDRLPAIPAGVRSLVAGALDLGRTVKVGAEGIRRFDPNLARVDGSLEQAIGRGAEALARHDLMGSFGPFWAAFAVPGAGDLLPGTRGSNREYASYAVTVALADPARFGRGIDALVQAANRAFAEATAGPGDPPALKLERVDDAGPGGARGYRLASPGRVVFWLSDAIQPTLLMAGDRAVLAANPAIARAALAGDGGRWQPEGEVARALALLPAQLGTLSISDPANSAIPGQITNLPALVQMAATLIGIDEADGKAAGVLGVLGVPGPGGFRLRIAPEQIPPKGPIRAALFPGVAATVADDRGLRWISREAWPADGVASMFEFKYTVESGKPAKFEVDLKLTPPGGGK